MDLTRHKIDGYSLRFAFINNEACSNLYYVLVEGESLNLVLYVDSILEGTT